MSYIATLWLFEGILIHSFLNLEDLLKQPSHLLSLGSSPWLHGRTIWKVLRTPEAQTTLSNYSRSWDGPGIRNILSPRWFQCIMVRITTLSFEGAFVCMPWVVIHLVFKPCPWKQEWKLRMKTGRRTQTSSVCAEAPSREDTLSLWRHMGLWGGIVHSNQKEQSPHTCTMMDRSGDALWFIKESSFSSLESPVQSGEPPCGLPGPGSIRLLLW